MGDVITKAWLKFGHECVITCNMDAISYPCPNFNADLLTQMVKGCRLQIDIIMACDMQKLAIERCVNDSLFMIIK